MSGGDWIEEFTGGWAEPAPAPRPANTARKTVELIVCPKCLREDVRCTKRQQTHSNWTCDGCFHGWKEGPEVGRTKGYIA